MVNLRSTRKKIRSENRGCKCVVMSVYIIASQKRSLFSQCTFGTRKNYRCKHPEGLQIFTTLRFKKCYLFQKQRVALKVGCMCVVVYESMESKEERRNKKQPPCIYTKQHTHAPNQPIPETAETGGPLTNALGDAMFLLWFTLHRL